MVSFAVGVDVEGMGNVIRAGAPGEGGHRLPVSAQSVLDDIERYPRLRLHGAQSFRLEVFLKERVDSGVQVRAEGGQRVGRGRILLVDGKTRRIRGHGGTAWSVAIHLKEGCGNEGVGGCTIAWGE